MPVSGIRGCGIVSAIQRTSWDWIRLLSAIGGSAGEWADHIAAHGRSAGDPVVRIAAFRYVGNWNGTIAVERISSVPRLAL
ncbi:MAG TPA: hypothetical protein PLQ49_07005 [Methanothrix sp.]|nr:hypothetical protein [Methanothrix sp.]